MVSSMGAVSIAYKNDSIPERDMLRVLVSRVERLREGKDKQCEKSPPARPTNIRVWGRQSNAREFQLNSDGTATYTVRTGETLRAVVADVLRAVYNNRIGYEPGYGELMQAMAEVKAESGSAIDFEMMSSGDVLQIPSSLVSRIVGCP